MAQALKPASGTFGQSLLAHSDPSRPSLGLRPSSSSQAGPEPKVLQALVLDIFPG